MKNVLRIKNEWKVVTLLLVFGVFGTFYGLFGSYFGHILVIAPKTWALDPVEDLQKQIDELAKLKNLSEGATKPLESDLKSIEGRIAGARNGILKAKKDAEVVASTISERETALVAQKDILQKIVFDQYKQIKGNNNWAILLESGDFSDRIKEINYQNRLQNKNSAIISDIGGVIIALNQDRAELEKRQVTLAEMQKTLNSQADFFKVEIDKAKDYQKKLGTQIAALSAQQTNIINSRSGGSTITAVGDVAMADDFNASIAYKDQAPNGSFAVFSFGGYTHRNGMSQYGAKQRAAEGQSVEEILKAYYGGTKLVKDYSGMSADIDVAGYGKISFEDNYLQGIAEMPSSWPLEALKAQAIAARTYAIRYTNGGSKQICTTEACQVYNGGKKGGDWEKAVNETKGWVLVKEDSGEPASTQYASTHGGYSNTGGWDTTDKSGGGSWADRAWENKAKSPWFYKAWYRSGYSVKGDACGRSHPWQSGEEMADILNAWIVRREPNGADTGRILPTTINSCGVGGANGNPYSMQEMRDMAGNSGGAVTSISDVSVSHNDKGETASVRFSTNRGEISMSGSEFKQIFNLRAPGYLRIPQSSFAFFNIEFKK